MRKREKWEGVWVEVWKSGQENGDIFNSVNNKYKVIRKKRMSECNKHVQELCVNVTFPV